jgi:glycosyltransferase involved in cell wall biosynthesis
MSNLSLVSIIIPCRNEGKYIANCLDSIIANDYPKDKLEVLVVDGMSEERTRQIVKKYSEMHSFIKPLDNPKRVTPVAMNIGITNAKGDLLVMINSHSVIDKNFLKNSIECLERTDADAVGGMLNTINDEEGIIARAIPLAADSVFGAGGRRYRSRADEGFISDTLPYCVYRREVFDRIGLIDEELIRNQDEEFNYRLLKAGGKIYYLPSVKSYLHLRPTFWKLWRQHIQYGYFKPLVCQKVGTLFVWRQLIPATFVGSLILTGLLSFLNRYSLWMFFAILGLYLVANTAFSFHIALKNGLKLFFVLPVAYATLHFGYGLGFLKGIWDFMILKKHLRQKIKDVELTR